MRLKTLCLGLLIGLASAAGARAEDVTLYDVQGRPIAYLETLGDQHVITLLSGQKAGYEDDGEVWGANGRLLGTFEYGLLKDTYGFVVGGTKEALGMIHASTPPGAMRTIPEIPRMAEMPTTPQPFKTHWSTKSLSYFLSQGLPE